MADIMGSVTSVLCLCQAAMEGVSILLEIYRAPEEVKLLQEQMENFYEILKATPTSQTTSGDDILRRSLSRAHKTIEDLQQLIHSKLIRPGNTSGYACRKAWFKHKREIAKLCDNLKEARQFFLEAVSVKHLLELNHLRQSTHDIKLTLGRTNQQPSSLRPTDTNLHRKSNLVERILSHSGPTQSTSRGCYDIQNISSTYSSSVKSTHYLRRLLHPDSSNGTLLVCGRGMRHCNRSQSVHLHGSEALRGRPPRKASINPFEMLATFRPETYTSHEVVPALWFHSGHELYIANDIRFFAFGTFFCQSPSKWTRITMCLSIDIRSKYRNLQMTNNCGFDNCQKGVALPKSLMSKLEKLLELRLHLPQDTHIESYLDQDLRIKLIQQSSKQSSHLRQCLVERRKHLQEITDIAYHLNCLRYSDRELVSRQSLSRSRSSEVFIVYLANRWVFEYCLGIKKSEVEKNVYIMKVLHCLKGVQGVVDFVGVVEAENRGLVTSFLCEVPVKGRLSRIIDEANKRGRQISWQQRERWCKQIVRGVAEMHSRGFVAGHLNESPCAGICVDANNNAVLAGRFRKMFSHYSDRIGEMPPEYGQSVTSDMKFEASFQTDIYHLGLLLWRIAATTNVLRRPQLCTIAGCSNKDKVECTMPHADPVQLPIPAEDVPPYFSDIINMCRMESPSDRASAWKLLQMFPSSIEELQLDAKHAFHCQVRPEDLIKNFQPKVGCCNCDSSIVLRWFNCNVCDQASYDLCYNCFAAGRHCLDEDHWLREHFDGKAEEMLFSNVKQDGQRLSINLFDRPSLP